MPEPAIDGTYPHPGIPGATVTAGKSHLIPWLNRYAGRRLACDIETYGLGLDSRRIKCVVFAVPDHVVIMDPRDPWQADLMRKVFQRTEQLVFHNGVFDVVSLTFNQLMLPQHVNKVHDTIIPARMVEPDKSVPKTLEAVTRRHLKIISKPITDTFKTLGYSKQEGYRRMDIDSPAYLFGAGADGLVTARLVEPLNRAALDRLTTGHPYSRLQPQGPGWAQAEIDKHQQYNRIMLRRTVAGLRVDLEFLEDYRRRTGPDRARHAATLKAAGIDPGNGNHLVKFLVDNNALPPDHPMTAGGEKVAPRPSTKADDLETLIHPMAKVFLEWKQADKVEKDYLAKVVELARPDAHGDLRIHPEVKPLAAAHGRSSMGDPPIQQFPELARGIVLADRGDRFASVDWAQQEPVMGMNMAGDVDALADYEHRGKKIYEFVSSISGVDYSVSKVILLAGMYGEGLKKLSADLNLDRGPYVQRQNRDTGEMEIVATFRAARELQGRVFGAIPRTKELIDNLKAQSRQYGSVSTINGRILPIPFGTFNGKRSRQNHKAPNYRISGSAADQLIDVIIEIDRQGLSSGLYLGMHDEAVVSADIAHDVQKIMEVPPEGLIRMARRIPKIRTDLAVMGERWEKV